MTPSFEPRSWTIARLGPLAATSGFFACCATTPLGATDAHLAQAKERAPSGNALYARECAGCHGTRGEGLAATPALMGPGALPSYGRDPAMGPTQSDPKEQFGQDQLRLHGAVGRGRLENAADLYGLLRLHMPKMKQAPDPLTPAEYWSIVTFVVLANGGRVPAEGVTRENATAIVVR